VQNPWLSLPETPPFVLVDDKHIISEVKPHYQIHLEILPEPYTGNPDANIILLNLNPGFYDRNEKFVLGDAYFQKTSRANLAYAWQEYPFYLLDPGNSRSPGYEWYRKKFRRLIDQFGLKKVAKEICVIEYFPYHSEKKIGRRFRIPSQAYSFYLVQEAMRRNALIILMRSRKEWQEAVPGLKSYHNYYVLINPRNPAISQNNCPDGFPEILKILNRRLT
jgi:hypothetical protein